jgi:hypothetical protein
MTEEDKIVGGIASFALILVVGAVFGRLHGSKNGGEPAGIGDRVMFGLLSLPVVALAVRVGFPQLRWWALAAPVPILIYTVLLALTEKYLPPPAQAVSSPAQAVSPPPQTAPPPAQTVSPPADQASARCLTRICNCVASCLRLIRNYVASYFTPILFGLVLLTYVIMFIVAGVGLVHCEGDCFEQKHQILQGH